MNRVLSLLVCCAICVLIFLGGKSAHAQEGIDTLVLSPKLFHKALQPWVEYRQQQGHKIKVVAPRETFKAIDRQITEIADSQKNKTLKNVLIVGDGNHHGSHGEAVVLTGMVRAKVNVQFGSDPTIPTDSAYADLDEDGLPDLTIGRIPVDSADEVRQFTRRVIEYEKSNNGTWQRRINCVAGVGGFGPMIDGLIEQTTKQMLTDLVPPSFDTTMTYGSWTSPYCPDPRKFASEAIDRFNEGCMFWVYIGHGSRHRLDRIHMPDQSHEILSNQTVSKLNCQNGDPIAIFLACYTGDFHDPRDCLAENMLRQPEGPIAVVCGTRVTMPYAMGLLSLEMVHEYFDGKAETLGELIRVAKRRMVDGSENHPEYREMIEGMGKTFSPLPKLLKQERLEHVHLMHLLGDPLLRVKRPSKLKMDVVESCVAGETLVVGCDIPVEGILKIDLAYKRDRLRNRMPRRREYDSSETSFSEYQSTYEQACDLVCTDRSILVRPGSVKLDLEIPPSATGKCVVRAMLVSEDGLHLGASPILLKRPKSKSNLRAADNNDGRLR